MPFINPGSIEELKRANESITAELREQLSLEERLANVGRGGASRGGVSPTPSTYAPASSRQREEFGRMFKDELDGYSRRFKAEGGIGEFRGGIRGGRQIAELLQGNIGSRTIEGVAHTAAPLFGGGIGKALLAGGAVAGGVAAAYETGRVLYEQLFGKNFEKIEEGKKQDTANREFIAKQISSVRGVSSDVGERLRVASEINKGLGKDDLLIHGAVNPVDLKERTERIEERLKNVSFFREKSGISAYFWNRRLDEIENKYGQRIPLERLNGSKRDAEQAIIRSANNPVEAKERASAIEDTRRVVEAWQRYQDEAKQSHEAWEEQSTDGVLNAVIEKQRSEYLRAVEHERIEKYLDWNKY